MLRSEMVRVLTKEENPGRMAHALAKRLVEVHRELEDGLPSRKGPIDTGSGFDNEGWSTRKRLHTLSQKRA
jgi:hypothetical protein